jgi:hypothetical protein
VEIIDERLLLHHRGDRRPHASYWGAPRVVNFIGGEAANDDEVDERLPFSTRKS